MLFPSTYSTRTICPECDSRIRLEDVRFTPAFPCPSCGKSIQVADAYKTAVKWISIPIGPLLLSFLGLELWVVLLCGLPLSLFLGGAWAYIGKYWIPPRLERAVSYPSGVQGLGL
jgi:hypothetical protein